MVLRINVLTLFPEMITSYLSLGLLGQAVKKNRLEIETVNPRNFVHDVHRTVDDRPFGGSDGMVMLASPLRDALNSTSRKGRVIYLSPQGPKFDQRKAKELASLSEFTLICGRYGGIDQRVINSCVDEELSIGDYVLSGGELAALVVAESISRFCPGVLGHAQSANMDSFENGWLEAPQFTRPRDWEGQSVPEVLTSGHHAQMVDWQLQTSALVTLSKRPDLWKHNGQATDAKFLSRLWEFWKNMPVAERAVLGLQEEPLTTHLREICKKEFS